MKPSREEREPVIAWHLKLTAMIDQAMPIDTPNPYKELEALHMALIEMGISGLITQFHQTDAMVAVNRKRPLMATFRIP